MRSNPASSIVPDDGEGEDDARFLDAFNELAERCRGGEPVDNDAIHHEYPEFAEALEGPLAAMRLLAELGAPARDSRGAFLPSPEPLQEVFNDLRPIGRGGMGIVYEARQASLGRRVALKFLPPIAVLDERQRKRFLREANAASVLDHGNIVPVIAVAVTGPTPYYAMKFIDGHSLAEVLRGMRSGVGNGLVEDDSPPPTVRDLITRLAVDDFSPEGPKIDWPCLAGPGTGLLTRGTYFDAVARLGVQAARALHHAHANGVIHGDVKPGNLLLDASSHLWLTDFGLAILKGQDETRPAGLAGGTPGYMSPEQSSPEILPIDHRTDVYSLGSTLYELATLQRPTSSLLPLAQISIVPPRRLNPSMPRDLETIVLKAMEPDVAHRYSSSEALADDLGRFLRRDPVRARRPSAGYRAGKWAARHRNGLAVWGMTVALLLVAMVVLLAFANRREWAQRMRAEASLAILRDLFQETTLAAEDLTEAVPLGSDRLHGYYGRMQRFYEQAIDRIPEAGQDPAFRYRAALANYHLAQSFSGRESGAMTQTLRYLDRSISLLIPLTRAYLNQQWYRYNLFRALSRRSIIRSPTHPALAAEDAHESLRVIEELARDNPSNPDWQDAVAYQHFILSQMLRGQGRPLDAEPHALATLAIAGRLTEAIPTKPVYLNNVHRAWGELAEIARILGRRDEEESSLREALRVHEAVSRSGPDQAHYPFERAELLRRLGSSVRDAGRLDEALTILRESLADVDRLRQAYSYRVDYLSSAIRIRHDLVRLHRLAGRDRDAEDLIGEGRRIVENVIESHPDLSHLRSLSKDALPDPVQAQ